MVAFASSTHPFFFRGEVETRESTSLCALRRFHAPCDERETRTKETTKRSRKKSHSCAFCRGDAHEMGTAVEHRLTIIILFLLQASSSCVLLWRVILGCWREEIHILIHQTNQSHCAVVAKRGSTNTRILRHMERHSKNVLRLEAECFIIISSAPHIFFLHFFRFCCLHSHVTDRPH